MESEDSYTEIWPSDAQEPNYAAHLISLSAVIFLIISKVVVYFTPKSVPSQSLWRWKNITVSLCHALLISGWAVLCFYQSPKLAEDLISTYTVSSHSLVSVSFGYFVYDVVDMLLYQRTRQSFELLGHHTVIFCAFSIAVFTRLYVGYAVVSLLVELNSIFLHIRQLLQILGYSKNNCLYRLNSLINLGTFVVFRISVLSWMTRWIVINRHLIPLAFYSVGSIGLAIITVMNIVLLYRLFRSDFISKKEKISRRD
ncbi:hypothetical protein SNE40_003942 [Patella caerulea]|uniref:TLC domain-containing protein n=1 Tax=Patella caerulea TaxID=87958 RepID=A0AAN8Q608_PATCE